MRPRAGQSRRRHAGHHASSLFCIPSLACLCSGISHSECPAVPLTSGHFATTGHPSSSTSSGNGARRGTKPMDKVALGVVRLPERLGWSQAGEGWLAGKIIFLQSRRSWLDTFLCKYMISRGSGGGQPPSWHGGGRTARWRWCCRAVPDCSRARRAEEECGI